MIVLKIYGDSNRSENQMRYSHQFLPSLIFVQLAWAGVKGEKVRSINVHKN